MARKKPEAMVALDSVRAPCETAGCDRDATLRDGDANVCLPCYEERAGERAQASIRSQGVDLSRKPGEPIDSYRKRCMSWLQGNLRMKRA